MTGAVAQLDADEVLAASGELARVLADCVAGGASVSFMAPFGEDEARAYFRGVAAEIADGKAILLIARVNGRIEGTVQLALATPPNQPHRADVRKLLVHRSARGAGLGRALMQDIERRAQAIGRTLLVLDTASPAAGKIYESLGWQRLGTIPDYALYPDGGFCDTVMFWKRTMNNQNAQQIEYWNGAVGERWAKLQDSIDRNLGGIFQAFIPFVDVKPGERVLDIGCGCGTTTLTFALAVQPSGSVAGVDISAPMLSVARARAHASNADIPFVEADASTHDFQPVFDRVVSRFGVMFFADPAAAFANIRKSLVPGGRLNFVCWRSLPENGWAFTPIAAARALLPPQETPDPHAPGPFAFADNERVRKILADAGFRDIAIEKFDGTMEMGATPEDAAREALNIGPLSRAAADLDEAAREKIRAVVAAAMAKYAGPQGVMAPVACWFVSARN
jgi:SAM-dependent methyltransferase/GNAT superfamily N-acetyltransferase